jgi:hypothetical protein
MYHRDTVLYLRTHLQDNMTLSFTCETWSVGGLEIIPFGDMGNVFDSSVQTEPEVYKTKSTGKIVENCSCIVPNCTNDKSIRTTQKVRSSVFTPKCLVLTLYS